MTRPSSIRLSSLALLGAFALLHTGCSFLPKPAPDPTRHYVLTGPAQTLAATTDATAPKRSALKVGLRTVQVAPYLDTRSMIVRRGDNEIDYRDFARWAEPLAKGINRMLVARLHVSDRVARVFPQPYPFDVARDVDVSVNVLRCEGLVRPDGKSVASFMCVVEITRVDNTPGSASDGGEVLLREVFRAPETEWPQGDYAALASILSDHVAKLADSIIAALPSE